MASSETQTLDDNLDTPGTQATSCNNRQIIAKFAVHKTVIRADLWINLFEVATRGQDDQTRVFTMMAYLIDDALNWFASEIAPRLDDIKWVEVREQFISRFGPAIANPLVESQHRRLKISENVTTYYEDKMRLLRRVNISEQDIVAQLTEGMPPNYRGYLLCASPKTAVAWLTVALQLEATIGRNTYERSYRDNRQKPKPVIAMPARSKQFNRQNKKPPYPCKHCQQAGETVFHWHSECPRRHGKQMPPNHTPATVDTQDNVTAIAANNHDMQAQAQAASSLGLSSSDHQGNALGGRH